MNLLIIDNGSVHTPELIEHFKDHQVKVIKYRRHTRLDQEWADAYILSGGNRPVIFNKYYSKELDLIKTTSKPVIGICLGIELIARSHNSKFVKNRQKISGLRTIQVKPESLGIEGKTEFSVFESHKWKIAQVDHFEVIGWSEDGIEIIKHLTRPIIGLQFHPEVLQPVNDGQLLLRHCLQRLLVTD